MTALLFGSISTLADTSELQRDAFNRAFTEHGLDWHWDRSDYQATLTSNGGANRISDYAAQRDEAVDATAVHETKSKLFQQQLSTADISARPGVIETIRGAREGGLKVGLVTTTSRDNIVALVTALAPELSLDDFDVIVDSASVDEAKPDPAAYSFALSKLDESPDHAVAIEDNVGGLRSAAAAGVRCVAFPNENTAQHDFGTAEVVEQLDLSSLLSPLQQG